jgi:LSU ribosomal protein L30P
MARLKVKLVKSPIGYPKDQKAALKAWGLESSSRRNCWRTRRAIRGNIRKVAHLLQVEVVE